MSFTSNGIWLGRLLSAVALAACSSLASYAQTSSSCDEVTIDSAGVYAIKHSKIRVFINTHHGLVDVLDFVTIWPPAAGNQQSDIVELMVMADLEPQASLDCRILPLGIRNTVSCEQSVPELKLKAIVRFDAKVPPPYEPRMRGVVNYLIKDVFDCQQPPKYRSRTLS
jgi:hypothetical protein